MPVTIQLDDRSAEALGRQAAARGMALAEYLRQIADNGYAAPPLISGEEFDRLLDDFFRENPRVLPSIPQTFSREDIYGDHD